MSPQENFKTVRRAIEAFNTGDASNVHEFISPEYINRESQSHKIHTDHSLQDQESL